MSLKIEYREANLQAVMDYFVKGYKDHKKIEHTEWFLDPVKAKVIFKVYTKSQNPSAVGEKGGV